MGINIYARVSVYTYVCKSPFKLPLCQDNKNGEMYVSAFSKCYPLKFISISICSSSPSPSFNFDCPNDAFPPIVILRLPQVISMYVIHQMPNFHVKPTICRVFPDIRFPILSFCRYAIAEYFTLCCITIQQKKRDETKGWKKNFINLNKLHSSGP